MRQGQSTWSLIDCNALSFALETNDDGVDEDEDDDDDDEHLLTANTFTEYLAEYATLFLFNLN